jgi:hypothetical protein
MRDIPLVGHGRSASKKKTHYSLPVKIQSFGKEKLYLIAAELRFLVK